MPSGKFLLCIALAATPFFLAQVNAECNAGCSGHGRCTNSPPKNAADAGETTHLVPPHTVASSGVDSTGASTTETKKDSCVCFTRAEGSNTVFAWSGADCSLRTCPHGQSWDGVPRATDDHTLQTECSNRGRCDRKTGECQCFEGYTGTSCQRTVCPNSCSGRGKCISIKEIAESRAVTNTNWAAIPSWTSHYTTIAYSTAWDAERIFGCECDIGFRGADCSVRECPSGADPMGGPGSEEGRTCSGRGRCNEESGVCECFKGFFGTRCENQRANVV